MAGHGLLELVAQLRVGLYPQEAGRFLLDLCPLELKELC